MNRRKLEEKIFLALMKLSIVAVLATLMTLILEVLIRGLPALSIGMLTQVPQGGYYLGKEGGILNAIAGSLFLAGGATIIAVPLSLAIALYLHEFAGKSWFAGTVRLLLDVLWGIPSIVYGAVVFIIMVFLGARASLFWGIITVAALILPIMARAMDESLKMIPSKLRDAAYSLGSTRVETAFMVMAKQALPGIMTAIILAFGRGFGDAASVLFTAGYTDSIPTTLWEPVATLPLAVFFQLATPFPQVQERAYAAGIVMLAMVLLLSILTRYLTRKSMKYVIT